MCPRAVAGSQPENSERSFPRSLIIILGSHRRCSTFCQEQGNRPLITFSVQFREEPSKAVGPGSGHCSRVGLMGTPSGDFWKRSTLYAKLGSLSEVGVRIGDVCAGY